MEFNGKHACMACDWDDLPVLEGGESQATLARPSEIANNMWLAEGGERLSTPAFTYVMTDDEGIPDTPVEVERETIPAYLEGVRAIRTMNQLAEAIVETELDLKVKQVLDCLKLPFAKFRWTSVPMTNMHYITLVSPWAYARQGISHYDIMGTSGVYDDAEFTEYIHYIVGSLCSKFFRLLLYGENNE